MTHTIEPSAPRDPYVRKVEDFYREEVARHGLNHKGLGFKRQSSQLRRFEVLAEVGELHGRRILDVGAGLGDFLGFLWERGIVPHYTGVDLCGHLVEGARERFAAETRRPWRFEQADVLGWEPGETWDYVVSSGVFGLETGRTEARVIPTLARLLALADRAVAVNFLSTRTKVQAERSYYAEPARVLEQALALTPAVSLRHDYLPNDFTLYLYRERRWPELDGSA